MTFEWRWDSLPHLLVVLALGSVALLVLSANWRQRANRLLALFVLLVGGNLLAGLFSLWTGGSFGPADPYHRLAQVLQAFDPAVLFLFVLTYPVESPLARRPLVVGSLFGFSLLLAIQQFAPPDSGLGPGGTAGMWAYQVFLAAVYVACLLRLVWLSARIPTPLLRRQLRLLLLGFSVALVPRVALVPVSLGLVDGPHSTGALFQRIALAWSLLAALAGIAWILSRPGQRFRGLAPFAAAAPFLAIISAIWIVEASTYDAGLFWTALGWTGRWIFFSGIVGVAILRQQVLDYRFRTRESLLLGAAFVALVLLVFLPPLAFLQTQDPSRPDLALSASALAAIVLVTGSVALAPFLLRGAIALQSARADHVDRQRQGRLDAYRAVLEALASLGPVDAERTELTDLRRRLGLSMRDHETLATLVTWQRAGHPTSPLTRYDIERPLAEGGWGQAYLARERSTGRRVVLKRPHPGFGDNTPAREALLREARYLMAVRHPNVVQLVELIEEPEPVLVLEYLEGGSLEDRLEASPKMPLAEVIPIFRNVLSGLAELHARGFIHRDLKPANVLFTREGRAKICDFGLMTPANLSRTRRAVPRSESGEGTVLYMSPEQASGSDVSMRSDLYSVGAMLHRCLTGRSHRNFEGLSELGALGVVRANGPPPPARGLDDRTTRLLLRALAARPGDRFANANAMARALEALPVPARTTPRPAARDRASRHEA